MDAKITKEGIIKAGKSRWLYLLLGFVLLLLLGLIYAWSVFVAPLEQEFGWSRSETSMAFSICMSMFCVGGLVTGFLSKRVSLKIPVLICAGLIFIGFFMASRINTLSGLYISYGVLVGTGVGMAYNALLSMLLKWFPDKQGFASGLLLMGFGFGGMVLGTVCTELIMQIGWRTTFAGIGIIFAIIVFLGALLVKAPPANMIFPKNESKKKAEQEEGLDISGIQMVKRPAFIMFFFWASILSAAGLMLIGHATPLALGLGVPVATAAVLAGIISVLNGLGRVIMGVGFDMLGRKTVMRMVSCGFIISPLILLFAIQTGNIVLLTLGFALTGLSYGGIMPTNTGVISNFYGMKNYSINFSILNINIIVASFSGPYLAGVMQTATNSYVGMTIVMIAFGIVAFVLSSLIKKP